MSVPWIALDTLRGICDVEIRSFLDERRDLAWRIVIRPGRALPPDSAPVSVTKRDLAEAVRAAVAEARSLGWLEPNTRRPG
jgi:hypothetical protein